MSQRQLPATRNAPRSAVSFYLDSKQVTSALWIFSFFSSNKDRIYGIHKIVGKIKGDDAPGMTMVWWRLVLFHSCPYMVWCRASLDHQLSLMCQLNAQCLTQCSWKRFESPGKEQFHLIQNCLVTSVYTIKYFSSLEIKIIWVSVSTFNLSLSFLVFRTQSLKWWGNIHPDWCGPVG